MIRNSYLQNDFHHWSSLKASYSHEKEYRVLLAKRPDQKQIEAWKRGVVLEDRYKTKPVEVHFDEPQSKGVWMHILIQDGRNRQIRETCKQLALPIVRIVRVRIGTLRLSGLRSRQWRYLTTAEVAQLKRGEVKKQKKNHLIGGSFFVDAD